MTEREIVTVLELAESGKLPDRIEDNSVVPLSIVKELFDSGYLEAIDASSADGIEYLNVRINPSGREYLKRLKQEHSDVSFKGKTKKIGLVLLGWVGGIASALIVVWLSKVFEFK